MEPIDSTPSHDKHAFSKLAQVNTILKRKLQEHRQREMEYHRRILRLSAQINHLQQQLLAEKNRKRIAQGA